MDQVALCSGPAGNEWPAEALNNLALSDVGETHNKDLINDRKHVKSMLIVNNCDFNITSFTRLSAMQPQYLPRYLYLVDNLDSTYC